ncbi:hypothetical protein PORY_001440 [Pneumocystis oryctolagi]|uniref:Uncharacterized protein n=1 Tax=Pneumocystis oryctolagi TaxID=42067 RepID=A0ACB7CCP7_9ASCO|nr:hypothetical protein PORY_001440 [Pneumocystis oryctolagi]
MNDERLGVPLISRLILYVSTASLVCFGLGSIVGGKKSGLRFFAENAHRLPCTVDGWYFYHKTKNYHVMLGAIKTGAYYALRTSFWVSTYVCMEAGMDRVRECIDAANTVVGTVLSGMMFSYMNKLSYTMVFRVFYLTSCFGFVNGVLQDFIRYRNGQYVWYLES